MQFDRLARHYHWMELLFANGLMQKCRTAYIEQTQNCRQALLAGEGHGRFLEVLLQTNPHIQVTCVEWSGKMIQQARQRLIRCGLDLSRVTFQNANLMGCQWPDTRFDLIVTNFFLDCLTPVQLRRAVRLMADNSTPHAIWLLADFRIPETGWRRWRAIGILASLYLFFRISVNLSAKWLTPPDSFLQACGFELHSRKLASCGFAHSDLWRRN
jgi:ubiquinone/menaquinone biosynthesis C-methylase UbiE